MSILASLAQDLQQPEYVHVMINHLPIYGLAMGVLGLVIAMCFRTRSAKVTALALVCVSAASAWPVAYYGQQGYDRVLAMEDDEGGAWLKEHMRRADTYISVYYVLAALALAAILAPIKWPRSDTPLVIVTLTLGLVAVGLSAWIAHAGGKVRHSEFRNEPPPKLEEREHSH